MSQKDQSPKNDNKELAEAMYSDVDVRFIITATYHSDNSMDTSIKCNKKQYMKGHLRESAKSFIKYGYKVEGEDFVDDIYQLITEIYNGKHKD